MTDTIDVVYGVSMVMKAQHLSHPVLVKQEYVWTINRGNAWYYCNNLNQRLLQNAIMILLVTRHADQFSYYHTNQLPSYLALGQLHAITVN